VLNRAYAYACLRFGELRFGIKLSKVVFLKYLVLKHMYKKTAVLKIYHLCVPVLKNTVIYAGVLNAAYA
jgi:hypothetical protein